MSQIINHNYYSLLIYKLYELKKLDYIVVENKHRTTTKSHQLLSNIKIKKKSHFRSLFLLFVSVSFSFSFFYFYLITATTTTATDYDDVIVISTTQEEKKNIIL